MARATNLKISVGAFVDSSSVKTTADNIRRVLGNIQVSVNPVVKAVASQGLDNLEAKFEALSNLDLKIHTDGRAHRQIDMELRQVNKMIQDANNALQEFRKVYEQTFATNKAQKKAMDQIDEQIKKQKAAHKANIDSIEKEIQLQKQNIGDDAKRRKISAAKGKLTTAIDAETKLKADPNATPDQLLEAAKKINQARANLLKTGQDQGTAGLEYAKQLLKRDEAERDAKAIEAKLNEQKDALISQNQTTKAELANLKEYKKHMEEYAGAAKAAAEGLSDASDEAKNLEVNAKLSESGFSKFVESVKRFVRFTAVAFVANQIRKFVVDSISYIKELDKTLTGIATVTGRSRQEMWKTADEFNRLARQLGTTTNEVAKASLIFYQQGLKTAQVMEMVNASVVSAGLANIDTAEAADRLTAAINGFNMNASEAMNVADKFAAIAAYSASDFNELSYALTKTASSAKTAGMDMDHTLAFLGKVIESTREAPENIGTAFKTIIARMHDVKNIEGVTEDDLVGADINKVEKTLRGVGIALRDAHGQFRPLQDVIMELGKNWESLDAIQKANIATILAGSRQQSRFLALMNDFDRTQQLVETSLNSAGEAAKQYSVHLTGIEATTNRLKASMEGFKERLFDSEYINNALKAITVLVESLSRAGSGWLFFIGLIVYATAKLLAFGIAAVGANKALTFSAVWTAAFSKITLSIQVANLALTNFFIKLKAQGFKAAFSGLAGALTTSAGLWTAWAVAAGIALFTVVTAITWRRKQIEKNLQAISDAQSTEIISNREADTLEKLVKDYEKLQNILNPTEEQKKKLAEINDELINSYPRLIDHIDAEGKAYLKVSAAQNEVNKKRAEAQAAHMRDLTLRRKQILMEARDIETIKEKYEYSIDRGDVSTTGVGHTETVAPQSLEKYSNMEMELRDIAIEEAAKRNNWTKEQQKMALSFSKSLRLSTVGDTEVNTEQFNKGLINLLDDEASKLRIERATSASEDYKKVIKSMNEKDLIAGSDNLAVTKANSLEEYRRQIVPLAKELERLDFTEDEVSKNILIGNEQIDPLIKFVYFMEKAKNVAPGLDAIFVNMDKSMATLLMNNIDGKSFDDKIDAIKDLDDIWKRLGKNSKNVDEIQKFQSVLQNGIDVTNPASIKLFNDAFSRLLTNVQGISEEDIRRLGELLSPPEPKPKAFEDYFTQLSNYVKDSTDKLKGLQDAYSKLSSDQTFDPSEMLELVEKYPDLAEHVEAVGGALTIQSQGLQKVFDKLKEGRVEQIKGQYATMEAARTSTTQQIEYFQNVQAELDGLKDKTGKYLQALIAVDVQMRSNKLWQAAYNETLMSMPGLTAEEIDKNQGMILEVTQSRYMSKLQGQMKEYQKQADFMGNVIKAYENMGLEDGEKKTKAAEAYIAKLTEAEQRLQKVKYLQDQLDSVGGLEEYLKKYEQKLALYEIEEDLLNRIMDAQQQTYTAYKNDMDYYASQIKGKFGTNIDPQTGMVTVDVEQFRAAALNSGGEGKDALRDELKAFEDNLGKYIESWQKSGDILRQMAEEAKKKVENARKSMEAELDRVKGLVEEKLFGDKKVEQIEFELRLETQNFEEQLKKAKRDFERALMATISETGPDNFEDAEKALEDAEKRREKFIEGEEKKLTIANMRADLELELSRTTEERQKTIIRASIAELDALNEKDKISRKELERQQKIYNIKQLEYRLENLKNQKTVQTLVKQEDGTWQFKYEADQDAIAAAEKDLRDAKLDQLKFEQDLDLQNQKEQIENRKKMMDEIEGVINKFQSGEITNKEDFEKEMAEIEERYNNDLYFDPDSQWAKVKEAFIKYETSMADIGVYQRQRLFDKKKQFLEDFTRVLDSARQGEYEDSNKFYDDMKLVTEKYANAVYLNEGSIWNEALKVVEQNSGDMKTAYADFSNEVGKYSDIVQKNLVSIKTAAIEAQAAFEALAEAMRAYHKDSGEIKDPINISPSIPPTGNVDVPIPRAGQSLRDYVNSVGGSVDYDESTNKVHIRDGNTSTEFTAGDIPGTSYDSATGTHIITDPHKFKDKVMGFSEGGVVDYTGLAMVHGSKQNSEVFFSSRQAKSLYDWIKSLPSIIGGVMPTIPRAFGGQDAGQQKTETHYHIDRLEFPNVKDAEEIRKAIKELPRLALQAARTL